jgi:hypothetical protein
MDDKETQSIPGRQSPWKQAFLNGRSTFKLLAVVCLAIASALYAVNIMSKGPESSETTARRGKMSLTKQNSVTHQAVPPVDISMPAKTATATFALG